MHGVGIATRKKILSGRSVDAGVPLQIGDTREASGVVRVAVNGFHLRIGPNSDECELDVFVAIWQSDAVQSNL